MSDDAPGRGETVLGIERTNETAVVRLAGELDLYNAEEVRSALKTAVDEGSTRVVVDLSQVEFIDSTTLGVLVEARSKLGRGGLTLAAPQLETRRALQVSGLDRHLPVHDTVDEALAAP